MGNSNSEKDFRDAVDAGKTIWCIPDFVLKDKKLLLRVIPLTHFLNLHRELKDETLEDRDIIAAMLARSGAYLSQIDSRWTRDLELVRIAFRTNGLAYRYLPPEEQRDKDVALQAVQLNWDAYEFLVPELKGDADIKWAVQYRQNCELLHHK